MDDCLRQLLSQEPVVFHRLPAQAHGVRMLIQPLLHRLHQRFVLKRLHNVKTEMALSVLAYNLTRVMNIIGIKPLMAAIRA